MASLTPLCTQRPCYCSLNLPSKFLLQSRCVFSPLPWKLLTWPVPHFLRSLLRCHLLSPPPTSPHQSLSKSRTTVILYPLALVSYHLFHLFLFVLLSECRLHDSVCVLLTALYPPPALGKVHPYLLMIFGKCSPFTMRCTYKSSLGLSYFCIRLISALLRWFSFGALFQSMAVWVCLGYFCLYHLILGVPHLWFAFAKQPFPSQHLSESVRKQLLN